MSALPQSVAAKSENGSEGHKRAKRPRKAEPAGRLQDVIGEQLRLYYATLVDEPLPDQLTELVKQLTGRKGRQ